MATEVIMPQLGESVVEGTIGRWLITEGEAIQVYQPLLEVETDKVNTEIPAPAGGVLLKILVAEGATVKVGTLLALIGQPDETLPEIPSRTATKARPPAGNGRKEEKPGGRSVITPVVARIAAEHGIDLARVDISGSGRDGRITKKDILAYIEDLKEGQRHGTDELYAPTGAPPVADEVLPLTTTRRTIADHMLRSVRTSPHATTVMEADMSRVVAYREDNKAEFQKREGLKLTFTPFFIQAIAEGLRAVPEANSSFTDQGILLHRHINIGIAVALDPGLIVPVVKDADTLSLSGLQRAVTDLAQRARTEQLTPDEVRGSTFTLTNHGVSGSLMAMPIINQPNAGILGVGAIQKRPVVLSVDGADSIAIRPMCYLSFTFDHRIMDGAVADRFLGRVVEVLETWD